MVFEVTYEQKVGKKKKKIIKTNIMFRAVEN